MDATRSQTVTRLLRRADGEGGVTDKLLPLVYEELRELAGQRLSHEPPELTLQATALVHEAYLRLVSDPHVQWDSRGHFFAAAAQAMRRILVERARRVGRIKHGGRRKRVQLETIDLPAAQAPDELINLDAALTELERIDPRKTRIVMLRFFAGLTVEQTAAALSVSPATVKNDWAFARAWLYDRIHGDERT